MLYRMYDSADRLLYVGITADPGVRVVQHELDKPWWTDVVRVELEHFEDRRSVVIAEREAVKREAPLKNVKMNRDMIPIGDRHTPIQRLRMATARWNRLAERASMIESDRSKVINELVAWFNREPGAKLPQRPD